MSKTIKPNPDPTGEKLSTTDIPEVSGGGVSKTLQPGDHNIRVNSIGVKEEPFPGEPYNIVLNCEGPDMGEGFEGFMIDKANPNLGTSKGQVGRVRATEYAFSSKVVNGKPIVKEQEMLKWLQAFCKELGIVSWLKAQDGKYDTVYDLIQGMNEEKPFADIWINACLAGKPYTNKTNGYLNYDLYLPYFNAKAAPLELPGVTPSRLIKFAQEIHVKTPKVPKKTELEGFEGSTPSRAKGSDFEL